MGFFRLILCFAHLIDSHFMLLSFPKIFLFCEFFPNIFSVVLLCELGELCVILFLFFSFVFHADSCLLSSDSYFPLRDTNLFLVFSSVISHSESWRFISINYYLLTVI